MPAPTEQGAARLWRYRGAVLTGAFLTFLAVFTFTYVRPMAQALYTVREVYNKVFDAANGRIMTTPWAGAQGVKYTETEVLNSVFDPANNLLRTSGGGGGGGSGAFNDITSGTNTTATMTVGTGASLVPTGAGVVKATELVSDPLNCSVLTQYSQGITAIGAAECKQILFPEIGGTLVTAQFPDIVTAGTCTNCNLTVDAKGRVTVLANGSPSAPMDAAYWTSTANATLTNETDLGSLTSGLLKHTVAGGTSTPATAVPGTDYVLPSGTVAMATSLAADPPECGVSTQYAQGITAIGAVNCKQVLFTEIGGTVSDAQVPHLNTLSTGLTPSRCVETDAGGNLVSTAAACGAGGGGNVSSSGTPVSGQTAEWVSATQIQGVGTTGTGSYVKGTSPTLTNAFWSGVNVQTGTTYTFVAADNGKLVTFSNAAAVAVTLPQATTAGFTNGAVFYAKNVGTSLVTITPTTSQIDGTASLELRPGSFAALHSNGAHYFTRTFPNNPMVTAPLTHPNQATINVDAHRYNEVRVSELSQATQLTAPTGAPLFEGQQLRYALFTTVSWSLTYVTTAGGFAEDAGIRLPVRTIAGAYLILDFRLSLQSGKWSLVSVSDKRPDVIVGADIASVAIDCNLGELYSQAANAQTSYTFTAPVCTPYDGQILRVRLTTTGASKPTTWPGFTSGAGVPLPTGTSGGGIEDIFGFMRNEALGAWVIVATTQNPVANKRRRCVILFGDESTAVPLTDAQIVTIKACRVYGTAVIEEVGIEATGAFQPTVNVHNRVSNSTNTALLTAPLQAGTSGAYACARANAETGLAGVACGATLQNTAIAAGDNILGVTSGVANSTTNLTVTVSFIEQ